MSVSPATTADATRELAERYGQAWNDHDLETIMSLHADDMVFHLHVDGFEEAATPEAVREQFAYFFAAWPDLHFATQRLTVRDELFVHEFTITGTLALPFPVGAQVAQPEPDRGPIAYPGVDVIPCPAGRVARKDTYLDTEALRRGLGLGAGGQG